MHRLPVSVSNDLNLRFKKLVRLAPLFLQGRENPLKLVAVTETHCRWRDSLCHIRAPSHTTCARDYSPGSDFDRNVSPPISKVVDHTPVCYTVGTRFAVSQPNKLTTTLCAFSFNVSGGETSFGEVCSIVFCSSFVQRCPSSTAQYALGVLTVSDQRGQGDSGGATAELFYVPCVPDRPRTRFKVGKPM